MKKRGDMLQRANAAASTAPGIADRLSHAKQLTEANPIQSNHDTGRDASSRVAPAQIGPADVIPVTASPSGKRFAYVEQDLIDPNPFNARKIYRQERVLELQASIAAKGQETPGAATIRNGRYVLAAGHYRRLATRALNIPMLLQIFDDLTDQQLYEMSYRENVEREEQTCIDNALVWKDLLDSNVYKTEAELADALRVSAPQVNKTLSALRLDERVLEKVKEAPGQFGMSILYQLVLLQQSPGGVDETLRAAEEILEGTLSRRGLEERRVGFDKPRAPRKQKEMSRAYKLAIGEQQFGTLKEWDNGKIVLDITLADPAKKRALMEFVSREFGQIGEPPE